MTLGGRIVDVERPEQLAAEQGRSAPADEFSALFRESARLFWLVAAGIVRDPNLADDVVQEAAVIGVRKFHTFSSGTSFAAWMGQIVRFVAMNEIRRRKRKPTQTLDDAFAHDAEPAGAGTPAERRLVPGRMSLAEPLSRALAELGDVARACLLLRTLEGLEYSEISRLLAIPEGTAMSHVHRARQALRKRLGSGSDDRGVER